MSYNWLLSQHDRQVHAFRAEQGSGFFSEAVCEHSVPNTYLRTGDDGRKCVVCLVVVGARLSEVLGDPTWS